MKHAIAYVEIHADQPERAIHFYEAALGWRFEAFEGLAMPYWRIHTGGMLGGLMKRPLTAPPSGTGANAFVCSLETDDYEATSRAIVQAGGTVAVPKFAVPNLCWQGYFADTEGNTFGVFQPDPAAGASAA